MRKMRVDGPYDLVIVVAHALSLLVKLIQTGHISAQGRVDTHHALSLIHIFTCLMGYVQSAIPGFSVLYEHHVCLPFLL